MRCLPPQAVVVVLSVVALIGCGRGSNGTSRPVRIGTVRSAAAPTLSPGNVTLSQGQTQTFTAAGTGPYTWALQGGASGSVASSGSTTALYTAGSPGQAGATDIVTVTDTGAGNTTATATVTISKGVNAFSNYGGAGLAAGNGFPIQNTTRVVQRVGQTFQALAPESGQTQGMVTLVTVDLIRTGGGAGQNIKAEIHNLTGSGGIDDQGASNAFSSGVVDAQTALPTLNVRTKVLIPMTAGTALTVGTSYAVTIKADVAGTFTGSVVATGPNDPNGGVAWWYSKRYHVGGWLSRGVFTSSPADYTKDTAHNISGNVFIGKLYPAPTTSSISPTSATINASALTLTVTGTNFFAASTVNWGGSARTTTYVSATQLTAAIPTSDLTSAGTTSVTVTTPAPGGGTSGGQTFTVSGSNPVPTLSSLNPTSVTTNDPQLTLTVNGTNFVSISSVLWGGSARTTAYVSSTQLTATIPASDLTTAATTSVTVTTAAPGGGTTSGQNFTVNNPLPTMTSVNPSWLLEGSAAFTLTVNGTGFVSGSTVNWAGAARTTTYVSATQLTAAVLVGDVATSGVFNVTATNATPGGGTSAAQVFTVNGNVGFFCTGTQCWGANSYGQLGNNTTTGSLIPSTIVGVTSVQSETMGMRHVCGVINGSAQCWGSNANGQLGNNSTTQSLVPVQVQGLTTGVQAVATGASHSCAIINGGVKCWGGNSRGQLGNNATTQSLVPVQVQGVSSGAQAIFAGEMTACALVNGGVQCWGYAGFGNLGNNSTTDSSVPVQVVGLGSNVQGVAGGQHFGCALVNGGAQCWGSDLYGQLGDNGTSQSNVPVVVQGWTSGVQAIAGGNNSACAIVNGGLQCWGYNAEGELGNGSTVNSGAPVQVTGMLSGTQTLWLGTQFGCAVSKGAMKCWGANVSGQLGNNSTTASSNPVTVYGMSQVGVLATGAGGAGDHHSCVIFNGYVDCWGKGINGQLGNNTTVDSLVGTRALGQLGGAWSDSGGNAHTCAVSGQGGGVCWGRNAAGQLGSNSTVDTSVLANVYQLGTTMQSIVGGASHTCGTVSGGVLCWGDGTSGDLGNNATVQSNIPVQVTGLTGVQYLAAGEFQNCAVVNGGVQCWGINSYGQLGNNSLTASSVPVAVLGLSSGAQLMGPNAPSSDHFCAVVNGGAQCWGRNDYGQLGNNGTSNSKVPVQVVGLSSGVERVVAARFHSCAIVNGGVQCWGRNEVGQLGNNSTTDSLVPVAVTGLTTDVSCIIPGWEHNCVLRNGAGFCWGLNANGQLGNNSTTNSSVPVSLSPLP